MVQEPLHARKHADTVARKALAENEVVANRHMCIASAFVAAGVGVALILYIFKVFQLHSYTQVYITLPILMLLLISPLFFYRSKWIEWLGFKYAIFAILLLSVGLFNVLLPRHGILGYSLFIVLALHYYNPKLSRIMFFAMLLVMLICIYVGMLVGEYDPHLLTEGKIIFDEEAGTYVIWQPESPKERYAFLEELAHQGDNRFFAVLGFYYFPRALILTVVYLGSMSICQRTRALLERQIEMQESRSVMETELSVAEEIQRSALPSPTYQDAKVEILAQLLPAREVGGDFYDYARIDDNHLALLIGDVSGKGIPAAMFMMKTLTSFRASYSLSYSPKEIMERVNHLIYTGNDADMFATCFLIILNTDTGEVRFANAGHTPPLLHRNGKAIPLPCEKGLFLGGLPEAKVKDQSFKLRKGDALLLYTDGVTEAMNPNSELYGERRLLKFYDSNTAVSMVEFGHELEDDILEFAAGAPQSDDITYLYVVYQGEMVYFSGRSFPPTMEAIPDIERFIREHAEKAKISVKIQDMFVIALDEIYSNIVKYGHVVPNSQVYIRVVYRPEQKLASITIVDKGLSFDPREYQPKTMDVRDDSAPPGGLGWLMVRNLMDELVYHRINGKNVVSIVKSLK